MTLTTYHKKDLANILVFYFSAIRRDINLKFIQDTYQSAYRVVLNSLRELPSKVKVTGTLLLKVQSYHKN